MVVTMTKPVKTMEDMVNLFQQGLVSRQTLEEEMNKPSPVVESLIKWCWDCGWNGIPGRKFHAQNKNGDSFMYENVNEFGKCGLCQSENIRDRARTGLDAMEEAVDDQED